MFKVVSFFSSLIVVFSMGCGKKESGTEVAVRGCIPESELLSAGIVGGTKVTEGQTDAKNVVMIYSKKQGATEGQLCTATALTPRVLLTAGHCVSSDTATVAFTKPSLSCESGFNSARDQIPASKVIRHEGYKPESRTSVEFIENDIALVFLSEALPGSYPTYKIADPVALEKEADKGLYFWGFGVVGAEKGGAGILRKAQISSSDYQVLNTRKKVQVSQNKGHGICEGDSGGAALVRIGGEYQILGVNSYVQGKSKSELCNGESYLVLANSYKSWIQQKLKDNNENLKN